MEKRMTKAQALAAALEVIKEPQELVEKLPEDVIDTLGVIGRAKSKKTQTYLDSLNLIKELKARYRGKGFKTVSYRHKNEGIVTFNRERYLNNV